MASKVSRDSTTQCSQVLALRALLEHRWALGWWEGLGEEGSVAETLRKGSSQDCPGTGVGFLWEWVLEWLFWVEVIRFDSLRFCLYLLHVRATFPVLIFEGSRKESIFELRVTYFVSPSPTHKLGNNYEWHLNGIVARISSLYF